MVLPDGDIFLFRICATRDETRDKCKKSQLLKRCFTVEVNENERSRRTIRELAVFTENSLGLGHEKGFLLFVIVKGL